MKKLKLEDTCLTIEQAKELKALNINMDNCLMEFCSLKDLDDYHLLPKHKYENNFIRWKYIPTLTNTEMLEMLPEDVRHKMKCGSVPIVAPDANGEGLFNLSFRKVGTYYYVQYELNGFYGIEESFSFDRNLLRDALFEMIKYLKTNKLI